MVGKKGQVIASDILDIKPIDGVDFLRGDFTEIEVYEALLTLTKGKFNCNLTPTTRGGT
jgi:23S rRNA (uridine2552-2'-O)-methyltransferase